MSARVDVRLAPSAHAPAEARRSLSRLEEHVDDEVLGSVQLLVSELVTNSVRHAGLRRRQRIRLHAEALPDAVRVEVTDPGQGFAPDAPSPHPSNESGWGLYLVDRVAHRWGVREEDSTRVWFEIRS